MDNAEEDSSPEEYHIDQEKEQIKSLEKELKSVKQIAEDEKKVLQQMVEQMQLQQGDTGNKLQSSNELVGKLRLEVKLKTEQIARIQKDFGHLEDRSHQLELRASEVDQAEIALQNVQKALEISQTQCRELERNLKQMTDDHQDKSQALDKAETRIKYLEYRVDDLNYQVMQELIKNEKIEKQIEGVPMLKEKIEELQQDVKKQEKELREKAALMTSSRKAVREYKEKLRTLEKHVREAKEVRQDLDLSKYEVATLKRLLAGKDVLVLQKARALDFAKNVIETLNQGTDEDQLEKVHQLLERSSILLSSHTSSTGSSTWTARSSSPDSEFHHANGHPVTQNGMTSNKRRPWTAGSPTTRGKEITVNRMPYEPENGILDRILTEQNYSEQTQNQTMQRPQNTGTTRFGAFTRDTHSREAWGMTSNHVKYHSNRNDSQTRNRYQTDGDLRKSYETRDIEISRPSPGIDSSAKKRTSSRLINDESPHLEISDILQRILYERGEIVGTYTLAEEDQIASLFANVGDRVFVKFPQVVNNQRASRSIPVIQRFGKRKAAKEKQYCGIVKYKGNLDKEEDDPRLFVGIKLDEPVGDTDGMLRENRYMYATPNYGKFLRITNIVSVLYVPSSHYVELSALKKEYLQQRM